MVSGAGRNFGSSVVLKSARDNGSQIRDQLSRARPVFPNTNPKRLSDFGMRPNRVLLGLRRPAPTGDRQQEKQCGAMKESHIGDSIPGAAA